MRWIWPATPLHGGYGRPTLTKPLMQGKEIRSKPTIIEKQLSYRGEHSNVVCTTCVFTLP